MDARLVDDHHILVLFGSLPPELISSISGSATGPTLSKLLLRLQYLDAALFKLGEHLPFYNVLKTATVMTVIPAQIAKFEAHLEVVIAVEQELWGSG
ncbi:MAG: hypothetical protein AAF830_15660 [Pseudomonadota bacterium]